MIKIIFLDIDGVMKTGKLAEELKDNLVTYRYAMDQDAIKALNKICEKTSAKVVISSTWGIAAKEYLWRNGTKASIIDETKRIDDASRGQEIQAWLDNNGPVDKFVIIDDDADMDHLISNLFQTDYYSGLTMEMADKIIEILEE